MSALEEMLGESKPPRPRGCPVCGVKNEAAVLVRISELDENGTRTRGRSKGRSISFCGDHGVEMFTALLARLEEPT